MFVKFSYKRFLIALLRNTASHSQQWRENDLDTQCARGFSQ